MVITLLVVTRVIAYIFYLKKYRHFLNKYFSSYNVSLSPYVHKFISNEGDILCVGDCLSFDNIKKSLIENIDSISVARIVNDQLQNIIDEFKNTNQSLNMYDGVCFYYNLGLETNVCITFVNHKLMGSDFNQIKKHNKVISCRINNDEHITQKSMYKTKSARMK